MLFIQQSIVGFDEYMKVQAEHGMLMFCGDQNRFNLKVSVLTCGLASFHFMLFIEKKTCSMGSLARGSACVNGNVL